MKDLLLLSFLLLLVSCQKNEIEKAETQKTAYNNLVNLSDLEVGQKSVYINFYTDCENQDSAFLWIGDTLWLEVMEEEGQLFFKETYKKKGLYSTEALIYPVIEDAHEGHIILRERRESKLFNFYGSDYIPFIDKYSLPTTYQAGCRLMLNNEVFNGDEVTLVEWFQMGEIFLQNKIAVSCRPIIEYDAYLIYDKRNLRLSYSLEQGEHIGHTWEKVYGWYLTDVE